MKSKSNQAEKLTSDPLWKSCRDGDVAEFQRQFERLVARRTGTAVTHGTHSALLEAKVTALALETRGSVGETLLHIAVLFFDPSLDVTQPHGRIAQYLVQQAPDLITATTDYIHDNSGKTTKRSPYWGENVLHMAIAKGSLPLVQWVMNAAATPARQEALLHAAATGTFFGPKGRAYFGEYPISFAVSMNHGTLVTWLVTNFPDMIQMNVGDSAFGNTPLHMASYYGHYSMYCLLQTMWEKNFGRPKRWSGIGLHSIVNNNGATALVYAAERRHADMFRKLWEADRFVGWAWGDLRGYLVPLERVDPIALLLAEQPPKSTLPSARDAAAVTAGGAAADPAVMPARALAPTFIAVATAEDDAAALPAALEVTVDKAAPAPESCPAVSVASIAPVLPSETSLAVAEATAAPPSADTTTSSVSAPTGAPTPAVPVSSNHPNADAAHAETRHPRRPIGRSKARLLSPSMTQQRMAPTYRCSPRHVSIYHTARTTVSKAFNLRVLKAVTPFQVGGAASDGSDSQKLGYDDGIEPVACATWKTVLEVATANDDTEILSQDRIKCLLDNKWTTYVREVFYFRFLFNLLWLAAFFCFSIYRSELPSDRRPFTCPDGVDEDACKRAIICEAVVIAGALIKAVGTIFRVFWPRGGIKLIIRLGGASGMESLFKLAAWVLTLVAFAVDAVHGAKESRSIYAAASLSGSALLITLLLGWQSTGKYVIMLQEMLTKDIVKFLWVLLAIYFGFAQAFLLIAGDELGFAGAPLAKKVLRFLSYWILSPDTLDEQFDDTLLFLTYFFDFFSIILMLILTAQFGDTYTRIMDTAEKTWNLERARIILATEASMPAWVRRLPRYKYWAAIAHRGFLQVTETESDPEIRDAREAGVVESIAVFESMEARGV